MWYVNFNVKYVARHSSANFKKDDIFSYKEYFYIFLLFLIFNCNLIVRHIYILLVQKKIIKESKQKKIKIIEKQQKKPQNKKEQKIVAIEVSILICQSLKIFLARDRWQKQKHNLWGIVFLILFGGSMHYNSWFFYLQNPFYP